MKQPVIRRTIAARHRIIPASHMLVIAAGVLVPGLAVLATAEKAHGQGVFEGSLPSIGLPLFLDRRQVQDSQSAPGQPAEDQAPQDQSPLYQPWQAQVSPVDSIPGNATPAVATPVDSPADATPAGATPADATPVNSTTAQNATPEATPTVPGAQMPGTGSTDTTMPPAAAPMTPQMYVDLAATGDMFEIESSKLALINSDNKDVKDFARHMVQDHTEAADKLKGVIKDKSVGVGLPAKLDDAHLEMLDKLQAAKGQDFDRLYLKMQQEGHQQALKLHQAYADNGDAAELKTYATVMVPIIEKHLTAVDRLARAVKGNT